MVPNRLLLRTLSGCIMLGLPGCWDFAARAAGTFNPQPHGDEVIELRTDPLVLPLHMENDPAERAITAFAIRGQISADGNGTGTVTFDESTWSFNSFGDATRIKAKAGEPCSVSFRLTKRAGKENRRRAYEIVFADGSFPKQLHLVLADETSGPHRLLIQARNTKKPAWEVQKDHILELHGRPEVKDALPDAPLARRVNLMAYMPTDRGLKLVRVVGIPDGPAFLDDNPNRLLFTAFGDLGGITLMGYQAFPVTLRQAAVKDPAQTNRRLFEIMPAGRALPFQYWLVLAPTETGSHRLLILEGQFLRHVLPLHDEDRAWYLRMQPELATTSPAEQKGIKELQRAISYHFTFTVEAGAIVALNVLRSDDAGCMDAALGQLTNLRALDFNSARFTVAGLPSLGRLTRLETLSFSYATGMDAALESLKPLTQLSHLGCHSCSGITDAGLAHLCGLKNLKYLRLHSGDRPDSGQKDGRRVTDAGLRYLRGMTRLVSLDLTSQRITDAGLEHLQGLAQLEELRLAGSGITDAGLKHVQGLKHLKILDLSETVVTAAARAALKAKLPKLQIEPIE
jgi:hypothetical protein